MAKKQNQNNSIATENFEPAIAKITKTTTADYTGNIILTIKAGKKVLSKTTYKNNGMLPLFKFIALCLEGAYSNAEYYRPCRITFAHVEDKAQPTAIRKQSIPIYCNSRANKAGTNSWSTYLHFEVPASYLTGVEGINQLCLYNSKDTDSYTESLCAYFQLENDLELQANKQYTYVVEWELNIANNTQKTELGGIK